MTEFQTHSESKGLGFHFFLEDAVNAWKKDKSIWKISWTEPAPNEEGTTPFRFVIKKRGVLWNPTSEKRLAGFSPLYEKSSPDSYFFVERRVCLLGDELKKFEETHSHLLSEGKQEEYDVLMSAEEIKGVYTEEEFIRNFG